MKDRGEFEELLRTLVGRSIRSVTYYEIAYSDGTPMWSLDGDALDSLDFGLTLHLDDRRLFTFTWGTEFTQYNVSISQSSFELGRTAREWDADQRWVHLLAVPIVAVATWWLPAETREDPIDYPQAVRLRFESGDAVTISASEDERGMTDHITVFFDEAEARRMGFGFAEKRCMSLDAPHDSDPVLEVLAGWGVLEPVLLADRQAFQTWRGLGSTWGGRLEDGRSVVVEVQDTLAEPWLEYAGGAEILDLREHATRIADEVRALEGQVHSAVMPWLRVEHGHEQALLVWMRESAEGEGVGIPSADASPLALLQWLAPVAEAVDWARQQSTFGLCTSPEDLVWHGGRARVAGWGREAFDRFVTCRNGETRVGVMEPEIGKALREGHIPMRKLVDISPNADVSVPALISTWLKLCLGKKQVWYEYQFEPLPAQERAVLMTWLESDPLRGGAEEFLRELGEAIC